ncbi:MAG: hypothetical protein KIS66_17280 [Fimbriimonadaceae bacterium]|nr:hypothetical protein [Fimbriimonadaceae bacterium]
MDTTVARPRWRLNLARRLGPRLSLGFEYNLVVGEFSPTANWIASPETATSPLVTFGTSSDRIFTPKGNQAYYATFAKAFHGTPLAPYVSLNYSGFERGLNFPFGVNIALHPKWDLLPMNDGRRSHLLLTYKQASFNVSLLAVDLQRPKLGLSLGWGF